MKWQIIYRGENWIMEHLFKKLDTLKKQLHKSQAALFLDYDGTLTPIVERPELAILSSKTKNQLKKLAKNERFKVFIISGRALADVKRLVGVSNIEYVGNHGFEIQGADLDFGDFSFLRFREILEYLKWEITKELVFFKGAFVEDKGLGLSVHYRLLNLKDESIFNTFLKVITREFSSRGEIRITQGKKVFEIQAPLDWDKGKAVALILKNKELIHGKHKVLPIYIGDDVTDEDAFSVLKNTGITVFVGELRPSQAQYYLNNANEVVEFLKYINEVK